MDVARPRRSSLLTVAAIFGLAGSAPWSLAQMTIRTLQVPDDGENVTATHLSRDGEHLVGYYSQSGIKAGSWSVFGGFTTLHYNPLTNISRSIAQGVSSDGTWACLTITVDNVSHAAYIQDASVVLQLSELDGFTSSGATAISGNGQVVAGWCSNGAAYLTTVWDDLLVARTLPGITTTGRGEIKLINGLGTIFVGEWSYLQEGHFPPAYGSTKAYKVIGDGAALLPLLSGAEMSHVYGMTGDAGVIVGRQLTPNPNPNAIGLLSLPVRWTTGGVENLGLPPGIDLNQSGGASANAVSGDGNTVLVNVLGVGQWKTWIWKHGQGYTAELRSFFASQGLPLAGWGEMFGLGISDDGQVIYGFGTYNGSERYYIANLSKDTDGDGLYDDWEIDGVPYLTSAGAILRYQLPGANFLRKDIFVEIDAMTGLAPSQQAMDMVVHAFNVAPVPAVSAPGAMPGVTLHVDRAEMDVLPLREYEFKWVEYYEDKRQYFGTLAERIRPDSAAVLKAKAKAYHYCIFADRFGGDSHRGVGEVPGNDFMLAMGSLYPAAEKTPWHIAGAFMHELGHNLGLGHGGIEDSNYKPNYFSVMNYLWATPTGYMAAGDGPGQWGFYFPDYSRSELPPLAEFGLDESAGIGGNHPEISVPFSVPLYTFPPGASQLCEPLPRNTCRGRAMFSGPVDWNNDGVISRVQTVLADINWLDDEENPSPGNVLLGHNDWLALKYAFRDSEGFADGPPAPAAESQEPTLEQILAIAAIQFGPQCPPAPPSVAIPQTASACNGSSVSITAQATHNGEAGAFEYHWQFFNLWLPQPGWSNLNFGLMSHGTLVDGADRPTITLSSISPLDLTYSPVRLRCIVRDICQQSAVSEECVLSIGAPSVSIQPPFGPTTCPGSAAVFEVSIVGGPAASYVWRMFDEVLGTFTVLHDGTLPHGSILQGTGTGQLSVTSASPLDFTTYLMCTVTDTCGRPADTQYSSLHFDGVRIETHPIPVVGSCPAVANAQFTIAASGAEPLAYQWLREGQPIADGTDYSGTHTPQLTVAAASSSHAGRYSCRVVSPCGTATSDPAQLAAGEPVFEFIAPPASGCPGAYVQLFGYASGGGTITYQWLKDGLPLSEGNGFTGVQTQSLEIADMSAAKQGDYTLRATNDCGTSDSPPIPVTLRPDAGFASHPTGAATCGHGTVVLTATPLAGNGDSPVLWTIEYPGSPDEWFPLADATIDYGVGDCLVVSGSDTYQLTMTLTGNSACASSYRLRCNVEACEFIEGNPATITVCTADADCSGSLAVADIFTFLNSWFAGSPDADFDSSGALSVADVFAFLNAWFSGC